MKSHAIILSMLIGFAHAAYSKDYTIEVCKIPLSKSLGISSPALDVFFHVWLRGTTPFRKSALSFETRDKDGSAIITGAFVLSSVTHDDFDGPSVSCKTVFESDDVVSYMLKWSAIEAVYERAMSYEYQAYGVRGGRNCGMVAKEAVTNADLLFPFEGINGQEDTANLLYGVGDAIRHGVDDDNIEQIATSTVNIVGGVINNGGEKCCIQ